jgi:hypothetical protein
MTFFFYINFFLILFLNIWLILNYPSKFKKEKEKKYNRKKKHWLSSNRQRPQWKKKNYQGYLKIISGLTNQCMKNMIILI